MTIAFIGLGNMGLPMASNLVKAGFTVRAYNRSAARRNMLSGATVFDNLEEAVREANVVITMLSDDAAVSEIQSKILPTMKKGSVHVSMSTISPGTASGLAATCSASGVAYVAAPVLGRPPAAEAKQLSILVSGDAKAREEIQPLLMAMSQRVFDYGDDVASANTVKLIMNYMIFVTVEMLSEVMLVAEKTGVDKQILLNTIMSTVFASPLMNIYGSFAIQEKDNPNGFATRLASKDLRLMQETVAKQNMKLPLGEVIQQHFKEIISDNGGERDVSLLISHLRKKLAQ